MPKSKGKSAIEMIKETDKATQSQLEIEVKPKSELNAMLDGFEFVPSDGVPFITLDNQRRFYLNSSARKLLGAKPYESVAIAYSLTEKALAVVKSSAAHDVHAEMSVYTIDKRYYLSARKFANMFGYAVEQAPYEFVYDRGSSDGRVFIFRLREKASKNNTGLPASLVRK